MNEPQKRAIGPQAAPRNQATSQPPVMSAAQAKAKIAELEAKLARAEARAQLITATAPAASNPGASAKPAATTQAAPARVAFSPTPIPTITRDGFRALSPADKMRFVKEGGQFTDQ